MVRLHLFIHGKSGVGKTTLINKALTNLGIKPEAGFITYKKNNMVYLDRANTIKPATDEQHWIGTCGPTGILKSNPSVFDHLGKNCLINIPYGSTVLMDELGFLELNAPYFQQQVLKTLDLPCQVIGVIKEKSNPFLDAIRQHPLVHTMAMDDTNHAEVLQEITKYLTMKLFIKG